MRDPQFGRPNYGGMAGAVVGGIGGLFALFFVPAIITGDIQWVISYRFFNVVAWIVSLPVGWCLGWLIGRPLGNKFRSDRAEMAGGVLGGLLTIGLVAGYGWYFVSRYS